MGPLKEQVELLRPSSLTKLDKEPRERQAQILKEIIQQPSWDRSFRLASPWRHVQESRAMGVGPTGATRFIEVHELAGPRE